MCSKGNVFFVVDSSDSSVDKGISAAVKDSIKLSVAKSFVNGNVGTTISAEKSPADGKQNQTYLWKKLGHFDELPGDFSLEKCNFLKLTLLYLNQGYLSYKDGKKVFYSDLFIIG